MQDVSRYGCNLYQDFDVVQEQLAAEGRKVAASSGSASPKVSSLLQEMVASATAGDEAPRLSQEDVCLASVAAATGPTPLTAATGGYVKVGWVV
jgi:hypothetical protein